jgi:hypothetical protein
MDYIFSVQNVVVVHHSFCGTTTLTPELLIEEFHDHHHADISTMFDHDSLAIMDFEKSIKYDIELLRSSPAVPKHIKLYGFFYEISSDKLTEVVRDIPAQIECSGATERCAAAPLRRCAAAILNGTCSIFVETPGLYCWRLRCWDTGWIPRCWMTL